MVLNSFYGCTRLTSRLLFPPTYNLLIYLNLDYMASSSFPQMLDTFVSSHSVVPDPGYRYPDVHSIPGSASLEEKQVLVGAMIAWMRKASWFAGTIGQRLKITRVDIVPSPDGNEKRKNASVECEIVVEEDMVNAFGTVHGGCSGFLVDVCSTLPLIVLSDAKWGSGGISQGLNVVFHAPALAGSLLHIKACSVAVGGRSATARCEIWDKKRQLLIASGTNIKSTHNGLQINKL
ncbi:hypothetical protein FRC03_007086 [Tulasnella sp. 419]|nr:hypothetical protein FRC02_004472 [Tulasnella sp. 418]KAG8960083.1 hypothetical protein FRC03_007086 [Tulasnella sp. 419]